MPTSAFTRWARGRDRDSFLEVKGHVTLDMVYEEDRPEHHPSTSPEQQARSKREFPVLLGLYYFWYGMGQVLSQNDQLTS